MSTINIKKARRRPLPQPLYRCERCECPQRDHRQLVHGAYTNCTNPMCACTRYEPPLDAPPPSRGVVRVRQPATILSACTACSWAQHRKVEAGTCVILTTPDTLARCPRCDLDAVKIALQPVAPRYDTINEWVYLTCTRCLYEARITTMRFHTHSAGDLCCPACSGAFATA